MSDLTEPGPDLSAPTRRTVLRAAGLVALTGGGVAVFGACSGDGESAAPSSSAPATSAPGSSAPASSAPASSAPPATSPTAKATASRTAAAPSGPSVATSKVPVGGGVILDNAD